MKLDSKTLLITLALCGLSTSALAQEELDEGVDPTAGDVGEDIGGGDAGEDMGGDAAPTDDGGDGGGGGGADKPISAKLLVGYGISLEDGLNPWGLGFGVGAGYNLDAIYLGVRFVYSLGEDPVNVWELGVEGGYDVDLGGATLRPGLGLGIANLTVEIPGVPGFTSAMSVSESEFYLAPGVAALFDVTDSVFLGAEARFVLVMSDPTVKALSLLAHGGMRF